jgi:hypothetical protein
LGKHLLLKAKAYIGSDYFPFKTIQIHFQYVGKVNLFEMQNMFCFIFQKRQLEFRLQQAHPQPRDGLHVGRPGLHFINSQILTNRFLPIFLSLNSEHFLNTNIIVKKKSVNRFWNKFFLWMKHYHLMALCVCKDVKLRTY